MPFPPGGPTDLIGRMVAQRLSAVWNQTVVVENRAGASGSIGSNFVARSAPDGYTLVFSNNATHGAYEQLNPRNTPYQTLRDFTPVALIGIAPLVLIARSTLDVKDARELIAHARANPGKLNYASPAYGSSPHLATELLKLATGTDIVHVPFTGAAPAMNALISGNVDIYMGGVSTVRPHVREGRARALAAVYGQRVRSWPDLPTMAEQGINGVEYDSWYGLLGPANMPAPLVAAINDSVRRAMTNDEARQTLENFGIEAKLGTPAEHAASIREEMARTARVIREANIRVE
ncbi:MAG: tripartite tricarboxylate transporter substrate binding protein [Alphaproteobacteria bacterium]|nr:tripartite tricarboxylate transporter substrate binding protein [Alphaproteobacteria bacterium]